MQPLVQVVHEIVNDQLILFCEQFRKRFQILWVIGDDRPCPPASGSQRSNTVDLRPGRKNTAVTPWAPLIVRIHGINKRMVLPVTAASRFDNPTS